ncbi:hypothetical protein J4457_03020 [Candidatus Woesearchaeota archaeon]|nr:hypothetical protein [Candidatus Woesearchaeota archaeon]
MPNPLANFSDKGLHLGDIESFFPSVAEGLEKRIIHLRVKARTRTDSRVVRDLKSILESRLPPSHDGISDEKISYAVAKYFLDKFLESAGQDPKNSLESISGYNPFDVYHVVTKKWNYYLACDFNLDREGRVGPQPCSNVVARAQRNRFPVYFLTVLPSDIFSRMVSHVRPDAIGNPKERARRNRFAGCPDIHLLLQTNRIKFLRDPYQLFLVYSAPCYALLETGLAALGYPQSQVR